MPVKVIATKTSSRKGVGNADLLRELWPTSASWTVPTWAEEFKPSYGESMLSAAGPKAGRHRKLNQTGR